MHLRSILPITRIVFRVRLFFGGLSVMLSSYTRGHLVTNWSFDCLIYFMSAALVEELDSVADVVSGGVSMDATIACHR